MKNLNYFLLITTMLLLLTRKIISDYEIRELSTQQQIYKFFGIEDYEQHYPYIKVKFVSCYYECNDSNILFSCCAKLLNTKYHYDWLKGTITIRKDESISWEDSLSNEKADNIYSFKIANWKSFVSSVLRSMLNTNFLCARKRGIIFSVFIKLKCAFYHINCHHQRWFIIYKSSHIESVQRQRP